MYFKVPKSERVRTEYPLEALLIRYGVKLTPSGADHKLVCKCPIHNDGTPSAFIGKNNKLNCAGCGRSYSVIDIHMYLENCTAGESINTLYAELEAGDIVVPDFSQSPSEVKAEGYADALKLFTEYDNLSPRYQKRIDAFLMERKLHHAKEIMKANGFRVGIKSYTSPQGQKHNNKAFDFGTFMQSRVDIGNSKTNKYNAGSTEPKLLKVNSSREYWIVEGFTDALACAELGHNVIFISGASNWSRLRLRKANQYVLALDNDKKGLEVKNQLMDKFKDLDIKVFHELESSNCKDMGEYLMHKY